MAMFLLQEPYFFVCFLVICCCAFSPVHVTPETMGYKHPTTCAILKKLAMTLRDCKTGKPCGTTKGFFSDEGT